MSPTTDDPNDPRLRETDENGLQSAYLVLSAEERAKGFVRPLRRTYVHTRGDCEGVETSMSLALSETWARDPSFYGATFCMGCRSHFPVAQFDWDEDGEVMGS